MRLQSMIAAGFSRQDNWQNDPLLIAAVNQRYGGGAFGAAGTTNRRGRQPLRIGKCKDGFLKTVVLGMCTKGTSNSGDTTYNFPVNFTEVYLEDTLKGTLTRMTIAGQNSFTVPGNTSEILFDEFPSAALGYPNGIPDTADWLFARYDALQGGSEYMPGGYNAASLPGGSGWYWLPSSGGTVSPVNAFGPITKTGNVFGSAAGGSSLEVFGFILLGRGVERAGVAYGDSLPFGSNGNVVNTGFKGTGYAARSCFESDGVSNPISLLTIARPGNDAGDMTGVNNASHAWFKYCTHGHICLHTNTLGAIAGNTNPAVYVNFMTAMRGLLSTMKAAGLKTSIMMPQPNATLTSPPSLTGQTDTSNWGLGGLVDQMRDTLKAEVLINPNLDACLEFNGIRDVADRNKWGVVPPYGSSPQYHPGDGGTSVGEQDAHGIMAQELRAFFLS